MRLVLPICFLAIAGCAISGCSWFSDENEDQLADQSSEQVLYKSAQTSMRSGNYDLGIMKLQRLEARFPFGRYAEQAQLEVIYGHFMSSDLDTAQASCDRFIRLHPLHPNVDYAYYMRGLTSSSRNTGLFDRYFGGDESRRDMSHVRQAFIHFSEFLSKFPTSDYATDAYHRMVYLRNLLAQSEVNIAMYYMGRNAYVAAANRARMVVEDYSQSIAVPDALAILVEANYKMGLPDAANDSLRILALNYPEYHGFDDAGSLVLRDAIKNRDRSWVNVMTFGLLDRPDVPPPIQIKQQNQQTTQRSTDPEKSST